jgi:hypothetical protein
MRLFVSTLLSAKPAGADLDYGSRGLYWSFDQTSRCPGLSSTVSSGSATPTTRAASITNLESVELSTPRRDVSSNRDLDEIVALKTRLRTGQAPGNPAFTRLYSETPRGTRFDLGRFGGGKEIRIVDPDDAERIAQDAPEIRRTHAMARNDAQARVILPIRRGFVGRGVS